MAHKSLLPRRYCKNWSFTKYWSCQFLKPLYITLFPHQADNTNLERGKKELQSCLSSVLTQQIVLFYMLSLHGKITIDQKRQQFSNNTTNDYNHIVWMWNYFCHNSLSKLEKKTIKLKRRLNIFINFFGLPYNYCTMFCEYHQYFISVCIF